MLIIDPSRDGCTVWHGDKVCHIKGDIDYCLNIVVRYMKTHRTMTALEKVKLKTVAPYSTIVVNLEFDEPIGIDISGIGRMWGMALNVNYGIDFVEIKGGYFLDK